MNPPEVIRDLAAALQFELGEPQPYDLSEVAQSLGHGLPQSYIDLLTWLGGGQFDDFMSVLHPSTNPNLDLLKQRKQSLWALQYLAETFPDSPFRTEADNNELLPWAITGNGDVLYWVTRPTDRPDEWVTVVNRARGDDWEEVDATCSQILLDVFSRGRVLDAFPEDVPSDHPSFRRYGEG